MNIDNIYKIRLQRYKCSVLLKLRVLFYEKYTILVVFEKYIAQHDRFKRHFILIYIFLN